jgi:hypothetical protein
MPSPELMGVCEVDWSVSLASLLAGQTEVSDSCLLLSLKGRAGGGSAGEGSAGEGNAGEGRVGQGSKGEGRAGEIWSKAGL